MGRAEVLSLLRQRTGRDDLIDLLDRRHPDVETPEELVPLAIGLMVENDGIAERVAHLIPEMTEPCRNVLRMRLQGRSFEEITEELDLDAVDAYTRCRRRLFPSSKPLPDYATGSVDRVELFVRALSDQPTFDSLRDEHTLLQLLSGSSKGAQLLEATENVRFTIKGTLREWIERPRSKVLVGLGVVAGLSILVRECGK